MKTWTRLYVVIAVVAALLTMTGAGCSRQGGNPPGVEFPAVPTNPVTPTAPPSKQPWYVMVGEGRTRDGYGLSGGPGEVASGQFVIVGQGDVFVDLVLFSGASLEAVKPFIEVTPASVTYDAAEIDNEYRVQVRWLGEPAKPAEKMVFTLRQGAPVGSTTKSVADFTVTIERRQEALFTVAEVGDDTVRTPCHDGHGAYWIAPGRHVFRMAFTKDVDRGSVEKAISSALNETGSLRPASPPQARFDWQGSRTVDITLDLAKYAGYYRLSADHAEDCEGLAIWPNQPLWLNVAEPLDVVALRLDSPAAAEQLMTLRPGHRVGAISGDGMAVLALEAPYGPDADVSGPEQLLAFLYRAGSEPCSVFSPPDDVASVGFCSDHSIWAWGTNILHARADAEGNVVSRLDYDLWPAGWAVSGDGNTVAYFVRSAGYEDVPFSDDPVWLDLLVYHPLTDRTERYGRVTQMPSSADFYGPAISMAIDRAGETLVFMDSWHDAANVTKVDLTTGSVSHVAEAAPWRWGSLTISPDGKLAAMLVPEEAEKWLIADLASGAVRTVTVSGERGLFSPDGSKLALACAGTVTLVDVASGTISDLGQGQPVGWSDDGSKLYVARPGQ